MEFIPETVEALNELDPFVDDGSLQEQVAYMAAQAQAVAPNLVGISIGVLAHEVTFTLVASNGTIAALDAVQYLDAGPCVQAAHEGKGMATTEGGLLDEHEWHALAVTSAAAGVRSTLTFPILNAGTVIGTVNMYGSTEDTFLDKHQELAHALQLWAPGAVTNADLSFSTLQDARCAPERLRTQTVVNAATGVLAAARGLTLDEAHDKIHDAATRAGVPISKLAQAIIDLHVTDV